MAKMNKYFIVEDNLKSKSFNSCSECFKTAKELSKGNNLVFEVWAGDKNYLKYLLTIYQNGLRVYENFKTDEITIIEKVESKPRMIKIDFK